MLDFIQQQTQYIVIDEKVLFQNEHSYLPINNQINVRKDTLYNLDFDDFIIRRSKLQNNINGMYQLPIKFFRLSKKKQTNGQITFWIEEFHITYINTKDHIETRYRIFIGDFDVYCDIIKNELTERDVDCNTIITNLKNYIQFNENF